MTATGSGKGSTFYLRIAVAPVRAFGERRRASSPGTTPSPATRRRSAKREAIRCLQGSRPPRPTTQRTRLSLHADSQDLGPLDARRRALRGSLFGGERDWAPSGMLSPWGKRLR